MIVCEPKSGVPNPQFQAQPCPRFKSQSQGPRVLGQRTIFYPKLSSRRHLLYLASNFVFSLISLQFPSILGSPIFIYDVLHMYLPPAPFCSNLVNLVSLWVCWRVGCNTINCCYQLQVKQSHKVWNERCVWEPLP